MKRPVLFSVPPGQHLDRLPEMLDTGVGQDRLVPETRPGDPDLDQPGRLAVNGPGGHEVEPLDVAVELPARGQPVGIHLEVRRIDPAEHRGAIAGSPNLPRIVVEGLRPELTPAGS